MENRTEIKQLMGLPKTAKVCGVSESFLRKQIHEGNLPYYKMGNRFKLYAEDVQKLIDSYKKA